MPERISRPPIRLRGGLPDGNLAGTGDVAVHFLRGEPDDRYAVVRLRRRQLVHDDDSGGDVAVLGVAEIEFPDQDTLQRLLVEHRDDRTGAGTLPFPQPETDADRARDLEHRIEVWATTNGLDARQEWETYFGPGDQAPVGPRGAGLPHLLEFVGERGIVEQPLAAELGGDEDGGRPGVWHHGGSYGPETGDDPGDDQADGDDQTEEDDDVPAEPDPAFSDR